MRPSTAAASQGGGQANAAGINGEQDSQALQLALVERLQTTGVADEMKARA
jgi:hypothetical protein